MCSGVAREPMRRTRIKLLAKARTPSSACSSPSQGASHGTWIASRTRGQLGKESLDVGRSRPGGREPLPPSENRLAGRESTVAPQKLVMAPMISRHKMGSSRKNEPRIDVVPGARKKSAVASLGSSERRDNRKLPKARAPIIPLSRRSNQVLGGPRTRKGVPLNTRKSHEHSVHTPIWVKRM